jgi:(p)ppGpp synthase/HD superfamily hydrolase
MREFETLWKGLNFAFKKYGNLRRKNVDIPYVIHPIRVAMILRAAGFSEFEDKDLMLATLFHDLLEDTDLRFEELEAEFGTNIALIVKELSRPNDVSKEDWLRSFENSSREAKLIKMADRIDNLIDMKSIGWMNEKRREYAEQGLIVLKTCGNVNSYLAYELEELINHILD